MSATDVLVIALFLKAVKSQITEKVSRTQPVLESCFSNCSFFYLEVEVEVDYLHQVVLKIK